MSPCIKVTESGSVCFASAIWDSEMSFAVILKLGFEARSCVHGTPAPQPSSRIVVWVGLVLGEFVESRFWRRVCR